MEINDPSTIKIQCPLCNGFHKYNIKIDRTWAMGLCLGDFGGSKEKIERVTTTQFFTCPVKDQTFKAYLSLSETPFSKIEKVTIERLSDD